ncbi:MAG: glycosyltransferase N-terminal domain-containing protein [Verrucomicrobiota bacterium]
MYLHAVSVGEANIALKLIARWHQKNPQQEFLLALGTTTGFEIATKNAPAHCQVLYAPLDLPPAIQRMLSTYQPSQIILIEAEVWPNLIHYASRRKIPLALVNARLSPRSHSRLQTARPLLAPYYQKLSFVGAQSEPDLPRLQSIGIKPETLHLTGSIKFDPALQPPTRDLPDLEPLLTRLGSGPILMALSTHPGEELLFARAASQIPQARLVIIPRHMERRHDIQAELSQAGFPTHLRTQITNPSHLTLDPHQPNILLIDTTGEMPAFTPHATLAFIGKTLLAHGGQNPCEAIAASVPLLAGPHFENFEPLATQLREARALQTISSPKELVAALQNLVESPSRAQTQAQNALHILQAHHNATLKTIQHLAT